ncbi:MAG: ankyrin repeat domain-containing protein [Bacteroidota bacterium]
MRIRFNSSLLVLTLGMLAFCACGNRAQNDIDYKKLAKEKKRDEAKEKINAELCALITSKEFVFSEEIKNTVDSLLHVGANINCDCEITNSYISKAIGSGYYFRKFFNRPQKTTVEVIRNPLPHFAYYTKDKNLIDFIKLFKADFNIKNEEGETLLDEAIKQEDTKSITELIDLGCKIKDIKSIKTDNIKIIDFVIGKGATAQMIDYNYLLKNTDLLDEGKTAQVIRKYNPSLKNKEINLNDMFFWDEEIVLELVKHGMDVNTNYNDMSILAKAISERNPQLIDYILANGFKPKLDEENRYTALFAAVENGDKKTIEKLISLGCNVKQTTKNGNVIHMCALNKKNGVELAEIFYAQKVPIDYCASNGTPLANAVEEENIKFIEWLFQKKLSPNIDCGVSSENPVFNAILTKDETLIKLLIKNGLDLTIKNDRGETPYECAIGYMEFNMKSKSRNEWAMQYKRIAELLKTK